MLSDIIKPKLCELGKIKIGGKSSKERQTQSGGTWRAPEKWDHFAITTMNRDSRGDLIQDTRLMDALKAKHADHDGELRQIPVTFLSDEINDVLQAAYVWYAGKKVAARSDGKTLTKYVDPKTMKPLEVPEEVEWKPEFLDLKDSKGNKLFKLHCVLNCVVTATDSRWGGVYKFRTTSVISSEQLYGSLVHLQALTGGILRGLPMMLVVRPVEVCPNGQKSTVYVVHVELRGSDLKALQSQAVDLARFQLEHATEMKRTQYEYRKLLCAPGEESDPVEINDVVEEFDPKEPKDLLPPKQIDPLLEEKPESAPSNVNLKDAGANTSQSESLPTPEISNRQHLENLQKQSDARLDAKMEAKREAVAAENAGELKASATETLEEKKKRLDRKKREKSDKEKQASEQAAAMVEAGKGNKNVSLEAPKEYKCVACQDTGHNSKGGDCPICTKKLPSIQEAATIDTVPLSTGEPSTLTKLEALYSGTSGLSVDDLRQRGRESWRLLTDEQRATVLRGMLTDDDHFVDDAKKWGPPQWRSFLGEAVSAVKD